MNKNIKVTAIQMVSGCQVEKNLNKASKLIAKAAEQQAKLVVLPEYFGFMGMHDTDKIRLRETPGTGQMQDALSDMAKQHNIWLIGGSVPLISPDEDRVFSSLLLYGPDGSLISRYNKIHLFGYSGENETYCESNTVYPGFETVCCDTAMGLLAFSICYDLRFPELYRRMLPFDMLILPAAFTAVTGAAHWEVLIRARAIENQCFVIAAAQGGTHENGRKTFGHSMIVDPWGKVLAQLPQGEGVVTADINLEYLNTVRQNLPALDHRFLLSTRS